MQRSLANKQKKSRLPNVAVVMHGTGHGDGTDILEFVSLMIHLSERKINVKCFAPDFKQIHVYDHVEGKQQNTHKGKWKMDERNVLSESNRMV